VRSQRCSWLTSTEELASGKGSRPERLRVPPMSVRRSLRGSLAVVRAAESALGDAPASAAWRPVSGRCLANRVPACQPAGAADGGANYLRHTAAPDILRAGWSATEVGQVPRHCGRTTRRFGRCSTGCAQFHAPDGRVHHTRQKGEADSDGSGKLRLATSRYLRQGSLSTPPNMSPACDGRVAEFVHVGSLVCGLRGSWLTPVTASVDDAGQRALLQLPP
jgi:hypothetical protein